MFVFFVLCKKNKDLLRGDDVDAEGFAASQELLRRKPSVGSDVRQFSKNIAGRAMVCTSLLSVVPREIVFGNCNIGALALLLSACFWGVRFVSDHTISYHLQLPSIVLACGLRCARLWSTLFSLVVYVVLACDLRCSRLWSLLCSLVVSVVLACGLRSFSLVVSVVLPRGLRYFS